MKRSRSPSSNAPSSNSNKRQRTYEMQTVTSKNDLQLASNIYNPYQQQQCMSKAFGTSTLVFSKPHTGELMAIDACSQHDGLFAVGGMDRIISVWKLFDEVLQDDHSPPTDENETTIGNAHRKNTHSVPPKGTSAPGEKTCYTLRGHKNAVTSIRLSSNRRFSHVSPIHSDGLNRNQMISTGADNSCILWDLNMLKIKKIYRGHEGVVNECAFFEAPTSSSINWCTVSDDGCVKLWNENDKSSSQEIRIGTPLLSVDATIPDDSRNESGFSQTLIACAGIDNKVRLFDIRKLDKPCMELSGHTDTVTSIKFNATQTSLASFSLDQSIHLWDVKSFSIHQDRIEKKLYGPSHNIENTIRLAWNQQNPNMLACGSADASIYLFDTLTGKMLNKLKGHTGAVNDLQFHPEKPILMSVSSDATCIVGDIA